MKFSACMRDCYDTCSIISKIEDGNLKIIGNPEHPVTSGFLCPKGNLMPKWAASKDRLRVPLIRVGERGVPDFKEISWDEALNITISKIKETMKKFGSDKILAYEFSGDRGIINHYFPLRFFNYINASLLDHAICDRAGHEALLDIYGTSVGIDPEDLKKYKLLVYWGINPVWTNLHGFNLAKKYGLELWVVDPVKTATAKRAHRHFPVKAGTDTLFALAVARVMVEEELYDKEFVSKNIAGFEEFKNYVLKISLEYAESETGINKQEIVDFARKFYERRGIIHLGYGFQKSFEGGEAVRAISLLPALVGHRIGFLYDIKVGIDINYVSGTFLRTKEMRLIPQMLLHEYLRRDEIKFLFVYNANPLASYPDQNKLRKILKEKDVFIVVHELFLTDTALYADIIFPANTFFERFDIVDSFFHPYILLNEKIMEIAGVSNYELSVLLAKRMGIKNEFLYQSEERIAENILNKLGFSLDQLRDKGFIKIALRPAIKTKSGKIEFYSHRALSRGLPPFPVYREQPEGKKLRLLSPTYQMTISSQYHNIYKKVDPFLYMNPQDAARRGIREGDCVEVFNEMGKIRTKIRITKDIPPGVVLMYKAFWPSLLGWNVNFLTNSEVNKDYGNASVFHSTWVDVRKV